MPPRTSTSATPSIAEGRIQRAVVAVARHDQVLVGTVRPAAAGDQDRPVRRDRHRVRAVVAAQVGDHDPLAPEVPVERPVRQVPRHGQVVEQRAGLARDHDAPLGVDGDGVRAVGAAGAGLRVHRGEHPALAAEVGVQPPVRQVTRDRERVVVRVRVGAEARRPRGGRPRPAHRPARRRPAPRPKPVCARRPPSPSRGIDGAPPRVTRTTANVRSDPASRRASPNR